SAPRARAVRSASWNLSGPTATATISRSLPASRSLIASSTPYSSIPSMTNVTPARSTRPPSARTRASASGTCLTTVSNFMLSSTRWRRASSQQAAGDHQSLDLVCALVDLVELHVAHELLHGVLVHVTVAAEHVDRLLCGIERHVGGVGLGDRRRLRVRLPPVDEPGSPVRLPPRRLESDLHVRQLELDGLEVGYGPPESVPFLCVRNRLVQRAARHADGACGDRHAGLVERLHGDLEPVTGLTQDVGKRHPHVLEHHLVRGAGALPQFEV